MPSPVGHALVGLAVGWSTVRRASGWGHPETVVSGQPSAAAAAHAVPIIVGAALVADLDLLVGLHSRQTHSIGAVAAAGLLTLIVTSHRSDRARLALGVALAYASHLLLDSLALDTSPPIGIMALWPFSQEFYHSPVLVFGQTDRRIWLAHAWWTTLASMAREIGLLGPLAAVMWWARGRTLGRPPLADAGHGGNPSRRR